MVFPSRFCLGRAFVNKLDKFLHNKPSVDSRMQLELLSYMYILDAVDMDGIEEYTRNETIQLSLP